MARADTSHQIGKTFSPKSVSLDETHFTLQAVQIVPAVVTDCPHCHSVNRKMMVPKDVMQLMTEARATADKGVKRALSGDLQNGIELTREALRMNPWQATAHGNLGGIFEPPR